MFRCLTVKDWNVATPRGTIGSPEICGSYPTNVATPALVLETSISPRTQWAFSRAVSAWKQTAVVSKLEARPRHHHSATSDMEDLIHLRRAFTSIFTVPLDHFAFESTALAFIHTATGRETVQVLSHMGTLLLPVAVLPSARHYRSLLRQTYFLTCPLEGNEQLPSITLGHIRESQVTRYLN